MKKFRFLITITAIVLSAGCTSVQATDAYLPTPAIKETVSQSTPTAHVTTTIEYTSTPAATPTDAPLPPVDILPLVSSYLPAGETGEPYQQIIDDSGILAVSLPTRWEQIDGSLWTVDNQTIGAAIGASTNLKEFNLGYNAPGAFIAVSGDVQRLQGETNLLDSYKTLF